MSIKCLLCGKEFGAVTWMHLKHTHDITLDDYREMFPGAELLSEETRHLLSEVMTDELIQQISTKVSESMIENWKSPEYAKRMSESHTGWHHSEESTRRRSESMTEVWKNPEFKQLMSKVHLGHDVSEGARHLMSEAAVERWKDAEYAKCVSEGISKALRERWKDPEFARYMAQAQHRKLNGPELQLLSVLDKHFPGEWKYVGDNQFGVEGRYPDFVNVNGKKQVIEVFGYYWHLCQPNRLTEEELIAHYREYGFECLVFWEYDVYDGDEVVSRILQLQESRK